LDERIVRAPAGSAKLKGLLTTKDNLYLPTVGVPSHLKSLQAVAMAVRTGSLKKAAEELSITPAAVGQRIKALEDYLGLELVVRGRSGLRPTPELAEAMGRLEIAFRELDVVADLLDLQRGHEIHVSAPSDFAELWLKPRLARFRRAHPRVLFCVNGEGDAPFRLGRIDCSISFGPVAEEAHADLLFRDFLLPITSPENLDRIDTRGRLEGFPLLHVDFYKDDPAAIGWRQWIEAHPLRTTAPERGMRFQRIAPALAAVLSNAGVMICGLALIADLIEDGRLALPYPTSTGAWTGHAFQARFAATPARPQLSRFRQWLGEEAGASRAWLSRVSGSTAAAGR
jgi:LysR family glycine cleavage system transcriptional activator